MSDSIKGYIVRGKKRAPKVYGVGRVCVHSECEVKLNRYNRREHCYNHAPIRYPRVRGRVLPENA
jgi:hypothetical protein